MAYRVIWEPLARSELADLPGEITRRIARKVEQHLAQAPRQLGEALVGGFSGYYRYRIGDYRVIYSIQDERITIHVVRVGHRSKIYD